MKKKQPKTSLLQFLDMFGVGVNMKINNKDLYKTRIGGLFTIMLILSMIIFSTNLFQQIITKQNPTILFQKQQINQPSRHDINTNNFSIAIALLDQTTLLPINDESVFTVDGYIFHKNNISNQDGSNSVDTGNQQLIMEKCTENHFLEPESRSYFLQLDYQKMYCIKPGQSGVFLEGQFDADRFNMIRINVNECINSDCKEQTIRQNILSNTDLQIYYSNSVLQITDIKNPFKRVGQTQFWKTNYNMVQQVNLMFVNQYVSDDMGLFYTEKLQTKKDLTFSSERVLQGSRLVNHDAPFYEIELFMEKNIQNSYKRTYLKFPQAISQIGGLFNVIFAFGCLFTKPYAKYQLQKKIIKRSFTFSDKEQNKSRLSEIFNKKLQNTKNTSPSKQNHYIKQISFSKKLNTAISNQVKGISERQSCNFDQCITNTQNNNDYPNPFKNESFNRKPQMNEYNKETHKQITTIEENKTRKEKEGAIFKKVEHNLIQQQQSLVKKAINKFLKAMKNYIKSYLLLFNVCKFIEFKFCAQKVNEFTDVCTIISRLIELQRIKFILFNDDQLSLLNLISQPIVNKQVIKTDPSIQLFALNIIPEEKESQKVLKKPSIYNQLEQTKIQDNIPSVAYQNILLNRNSKNDVNQKILQMIEMEDLNQELEYSNENIEQLISKNESIFKTNTRCSQTTQAKTNNYNNQQLFTKKQSSLSSSQISESIINDSFNISAQQVYQSKNTPIIPHFKSSRFESYRSEYSQEQKMSSKQF